MIIGCEFNGNVGPIIINHRYDNNGNKTSVGNSFSNAAYNANNQLVSRTDAAGPTETFTYDENGNQTRHVNGNNEQIDYTFDSLGRLVNVMTGITLAQYTYDNWNNILMVNHDMHINTYTYDLLNRPITEGHQFDKVIWDNNGININVGPGATVNKQYNANSQLSQLTDAAGRVFDYTYDSRNLLDTVNYNGTTLADYNDDSFGLVRRITYGNGITQDETFSTTNQLLY
ncbi:RHS repeat protein [Candidatus Peregrinibacteria bacterium]|nr:MAG: RHS repeat protein [Candidatus Peregrinibacteria bacterium]